MCQIRQTQLGPSNNRTHRLTRKSKPSKISRAPNNHEAHPSCWYKPKKEGPLRADCCAPEESPDASKRCKFPKCTPSPCKPGTYARCKVSHVEYVIPAPNSLNFPGSFASRAYTPGIINSPFRVCVEIRAKAKSQQNAKTPFAPALLFSILPTLLTSQKNIVLQRVSRMPKPWLCYFSPAIASVSASASADGKLWVRVP